MNVKIFFDESGKLSNPPMLMGGILINDNIYQKEEIQNINKDLQMKKIKYHFTQYNGNMEEKQNILRLFQAISPYLKTFRVNILQYKKDDISVELFRKMVYSKFPERVFYGLLRGKRNYMKINANIYMEHATNYDGLQKKFQEQLNVQALYRGEQYNVKSCKLVKKNIEIGVELIDLILGIIRIILNSQSSIKNKSNTYTNKVKLINEILIIPNVYDFLCNIKYFEWNKVQSTTQIEFKDYLDSYMAINSF